MRISSTLYMVLYFDICFRKHRLALDQKEANVKLLLATFLSHKQLY